MAFWSAFSDKTEWRHLLERILYTSRYSITQELLQHLPEFGFSYLFLLFFDRHPQLVCERVKDLNNMCHSHKKNMSCQACSMFKLNSDYFWERHVLKYFYTDRSKAVLLLWFLTITCSCCPYLYFGSAIMLVIYFVNFR